MGKRAILLPILFFAATFGAQVRLTRPYPTPPRSAPLALLNISPAHFYFLRYNRMAHDVTIEKRRKSDGSIAAFAPLKLDSVNATWFDYELLDHLLFEKGGRLYFVFERVLNRQSKVYLKEIDTLCRTGGFVELAVMESDRRESSLEMDFTLTADKRLLVTKSRVYGMSVHKEVQLIDPATRRVETQYKLPVETPATGYSQELTVDGKGTLHYFLYRYHMSLQFTADLVYGDFLERRSHIDSVFMVSIDAEGKFLSQHTLPLPGCDYVHAAFCREEGDAVKATCLYTARDSADALKIRTGVFLIKTGEGIVERHLLSADSSLNARLTFYDGTDNKTPGSKLYERAGRISAGDWQYFMAERRQVNHYKEILAWGVLRESPRVAFLELIPRKTFYFKNRARHTTFGIAMHAGWNDELFTFVLEHPGNRTVQPRQFVYRKFRRLESERHALLVAYKLSPDGSVKKTVLWQNADYSCIPVPYHGAASGDAVFYMVQGDREAFGVVELRDF